MCVCVCERERERARERERERVCEREKAGGREGVRERDGEGERERGGGERDSERDVFNVIREKKSVEDDSLARERGRERAWSLNLRTMSSLESINKRPLTNNSKSLSQEKVPLCARETLASGERSVSFRFWQRELLHKYRKSNCVVIFVARF